MEPNKYLSYDGLTKYDSLIKTIVNTKQDVITGTEGQVVQIDSSGKPVTSDLNLISVEDIDVICGSTIESANEVMF